MEITQVRVFPVNEDKLKAFASIIIDDCFVVSDIKIIQGSGGLFVSMPSKRRKNGTFRDTAHPLNTETRRMIEEKIIEKYREILLESGGRPVAELRALSAEEFEEDRGLGGAEDWREADGTGRRGFGR